MTIDVETAVADAHRREWAYVLAAAVRVAGDIDLAEECVQDAYARALAKWPTDGIPLNTGAWLTTVARRRAIDLRRRDTRFDRLMPMLADDSPFVPEGSDPGAISDDRLRLIFTCCHPALSDETQIAVTLRLVCGLTTNEVSRALLVSESTMAARITRAKKKIAGAHIPYIVPSAEDLPQRVDAVLTVVHLVFTAGHTAVSGDQLVRHDLVERALDLARMLRLLLPDSRGVAGLLALILLSDSRRETRVDAGGQLLLLSEQDRVKWDRAEISEGIALVQRGAAISTARAIRPHGGHRRRPRRGTNLGSHRLGRDRGTLRPTHGRLALAYRRAESCGRGRLRPRTSGGPRRNR